MGIYPVEESRKAFMGGARVSLDVKKGDRWPHSFKGHFLKQVALKLKKLQPA